MDRDIDGAAHKLQAAQQMYRSGQYTVAEIASTLGVSRASIYRYLATPAICLEQSVGGKAAGPSVPPGGAGQGLKLPTCCLEGMSPPSGEVCRVRFAQVRSGAEFGQTEWVRSGYGRWNDRGNDRSLFAGWR